MKDRFPLFVALTLLSLAVLVFGCGPAPNPKLQPKSESQEQAPATPAAPPAAPAVEQKPAEPAAVAPAEEPHQQSVARPKRPAPLKEAAKPAPARPVNTTNAEARPDRASASSQPGGISLPAPVAPPIPVPQPPIDEPRPERVEPPPPREIRVPSGTLVAVRMIDSVDSETAHSGETFKGSLDEPIVIDNETVFPKGSEVWVKLARVQVAGRVSGRSELELQLDRIYLGRKSYSVESSKYVSTGASQGGKTARSAGIGAAIGAAIGAVSGGGKGAVIGATTGAGAGAGVEAIRKGEQVRVESESRIDFRLEDSVQVTLQSAPSTPQRNNPSGSSRFGTRQ